MIWQFGNTEILSPQADTEKTIWKGQKEPLGIFLAGEYQGQLTQVFLWLSISVHLDAPNKLHLG